MSPETWMSLFTVVSFLVVAAVLGKFGWPKILRTLEERERSIQQAIQSAEAARLAAEKLKSEYDAQIQEAQEKVRVILSQAQMQGAQAKGAILKEAEEEARRLAEKTRQQLQIEKDKILKELQNEVAGLSMLMAEKLLEKSIDKQVQDKFLQDFLKSLEMPPGKMH